MKRKRRLFSILALFPLFAGCAMLREGNPATTPDPKAYPCGASGVVCEDARSPGEKCCFPHSQCGRDPDGTPYCAAVDYDPSDPIMMSRPPRMKRFAP